MPCRWPPHSVERERGRPEASRRTLLRRHGLGVARDARSRGARPFVCGRGNAQVPPKPDFKLRAAPCERSPVTVRLRQHVGARRTATMADATSCPPRRCAARASLMRTPRKRADSYLRQCCDAAALLAAAVWSAPGARRRMCDAGCKVAAPARQDARRKAAAAHRLWAEQSRLKRAILEISILAGSFLSPSKWDAAKGLGRETWGAAWIRVVCATSAQAAAAREEASSGFAWHWHASNFS